MPTSGSVVIFLAAAAVAGCAATVPEDQTTRNEAGTVVDGGDVGALRLQLGDCLADQSIGDVESVPVVPCDEPHSSEIYHLFDLPGDEYPGDESIIESAEEGCFDNFEAFVGAPYETSIYDISYLYPLEESWNAIDERTVRCGVFLVDGSLAVGSAAGIGK